MAVVIEVESTENVPNPIEGILAPVFNSKKLIASVIFLDNY